VRPSTPGEERVEPLIWILDTSYQYGNEFYGMNPGVALTPVTEKCFLTMSQALQRCQGSSVTGPVGSGKTETLKVGTERLICHLTYQQNDVWWSDKCGKACYIKHYLQNIKSADFCLISNAGW